MRITVIGAGSWGSAVYKLLSVAGHDVRIWARRQVVAEALLRGENPYYLPGVSLPKAKAFTDLSLALETAEMVVFAVPAQHMREVLEAAKPFLPQGAIFVNLAKGIEVDTGKRMEEVFSDVLGKVKYATLSGPSHAEEVARDIPTSVVVASKDEKVAQTVQEAFNTVTFRVYWSDDVVGVEIAGALKNVIAIAAGAIDGFGGWDNSKAALMTPSMCSSIWPRSVGAIPRSFSGSTGLRHFGRTTTRGPWVSLAPQTREDALRSTLRASTPWRPADN